MSDPTVLIISTEPVIGALLTLYVEACGHRAVLAEEGERPADAVARSGATVILVDVDHRDGCSPTFIAQQQAAGRPVIAFSPTTLAPERLLRVDRLSVPWVALPLPGDEFGTVLNDARSALEGYDPDPGIRNSE
jgi:DNA-binding response OmpR family regulator